MDSLFILLSEDRKTKRQIQILKYLSHQNIVATSDISNDLGLNRGTLVHDLTELQVTLPEGIELIQDFRKGYRLIYDNNNSIDYYISKFCRTSPVYKIIDALLYRDKINISELSEEIFLSESVVYRRISYMNKILKAYHISISTHNLEFVGKEADIRCFLFAFYRTFMDYFSSKPTKSIYDKYYDKTMIALQQSGISQLHVNNAKVFLWTVITRIRIMNQHYIQFNETLEQATKEKESYKNFKFEYLLTVIELQEEFNLLDRALPESEIIWAYFVNLDCIEYVTIDGLDSDKCELYRAEDATNLQKIRATLKKILRETFHLPNVNEKLSNPLIAYSLNTLLLSTISDNFQKLSTPLKRHIRNEYSEIYLKWLDELENIRTRIPVLKHIDDIACTLTMLTIPIIHSHENGTLNLLFSFEAERGYSSILVDTSKLLVSPISDVTATYVFSTTVTPEFIESNNIDILVSNFEQRNEKNFNCKLIRLSYIPTVAEWTQLRETIVMAF